MLYRPTTPPPPNDTDNNISKNPDPLSHSSSMQSLSVNDDSTDARETSTTVTSSRPSQSLFAKLTDAKKTLFGRTNAPDTSSSSITQNKALLAYIISEPHPQLDVIQEFERNGAQLNSVSDEGNTILHLLARAEIRSSECINIVEYLTKKGGCDPDKQNDHGWTAGIYLIFQRVIHRICFQYYRP